MSKLVLSEGHVSPDSPISVQLIKNHHPGARPIVVITLARSRHRGFTREACRGGQQHVSPAWHDEQLFAVGDGESLARVTTRARARRVRIWCWLTARKFRGYSS
jgi:hypothetical protein